MSTQSIAPLNRTFKISWIALLLISGLATLNHIALVFFVAEEAALFVGWAAFTGYAAVVLAVPFRRGERWAWYSTWVLVIGFASLILFDSQVGIWYAISAGVMAVCLLLTRGAFFSKG